MGNPNVLWWRWGNTRIGFSSIEQDTNIGVPLKTNGGTISRTTIGGRQVVSGNVSGADQVQIRGLHVEERGSGFPNPPIQSPQTAPPGVNVEFQVNDSTWYQFPFQSRQTSPKFVDLGLVNSNVIPSPQGDGPLVLEGGDTIRMLMTDTINRLNNSDRFNMEIDLWGLKI
jgi:hypothetical protein